MTTEAAPKAKGIEVWLVKREEVYYTLMGLWLEVLWNRDVKEAKVLEALSKHKRKQEDFP